MTNQISKKFKNEVTKEGKSLRPSDYLPILKELDKGSGSVSVKDILKFCEKYC